MPIYATTATSFEVIILDPVRQYRLPYWACSTRGRCRNLKLRRRRLAASARHGRHIELSMVNYVSVCLCMLSSPPPLKSSSWVLCHNIDSPAGPAVARGRCRHLKLRRRCLAASSRHCRQIGLSMELYASVCLSMLSSPSRWNRHLDTLSQCRLPYWTYKSEMPLL